jgi:hypothetical protein
MLARSGLRTLKRESLVRVRSTERKEKQMKKMEHSVIGLSKLLQEQQDAIDNNSSPLVIEQNNKDIWELRNKYACGSTWGEDPGFDKWWMKQVAKARNLNTVKQIVTWIAIAAVAIWLITTRNRVDNDMSDNQYEQYTQQVDH